MWLEFIASGLLTAAGISTAGWVVTRRRLGETLLERQDLANSSLVIEEERRMLELVAKGASLAEVLNSLTSAIERISPGSHCTVMLLDQERRQNLLIASGPSLPEAYLQAINGLPIGPDAGACGSAAFRNETVIVEDIATDYRFDGPREFIMSYGLRSCWSQPIRDSGNGVLGTFAMYRGEVYSPRPEELRMSQAAAQLAGNAIERIRALEALNESRRRLDLAEKVAQFGVWEGNFNTQTMTISRGAAAIMELPPDKPTVSYEDFRALVHPEDLGSLIKGSDPANAHNRVVLDEFRLVLPSGKLCWVRSQWCFEFTDGTPVRSTGAMIDITEEKTLLLQARAAHASAEAAARTAREAEKLEQDRKTILEMVAKDQSLERILQAVAEAVAGHPSGSLCSIGIELPDSSRLVAGSGLPEYISAAINGVPLDSVHETLTAMPLARFSGHPEWLRFIATCGNLPFPFYRAVPILRNGRTVGRIVSLLPEADPGVNSGQLDPRRNDAPQNDAPQKTDGQLLESWGQFASLAVERRGLYEQLSFRARYDSLTSLLNRAALYDSLDAHIGKHDKDDPLAVVYLDLDRFKEINDQYGHAAGDAILRHVSCRIRENVRRADIVARIGGDEFVIVLPGVADRAGAERIARLVVDAIGKPALFDGRELEVGVSAGVSVYPIDGMSTDDLLKAADETMYRTKVRRRSRSKTGAGNADAELEPGASKMLAVI